MQLKSKCPHTKYTGEKPPCSEVKFQHELTRKQELTRELISSDTVYGASYAKKKEKKKRRASPSVQRQDCRSEAGYKTNRQVSCAR